jgi:hypothetical protein
VAAATAAAAAAAGASSAAASAAAVAAASVVIRGGTCTAVASAASSAASSSGASGSAASAAASAASTATCSYTSIVEKVIVHNEPHIVTKNVIKRVITFSSQKPAPSGTRALVDLETVRLGRSVFSSNSLRPLAVVTPFHIVGGHVLISSASKNVKLVAATITGRGIEHAVILDLIKVRDVKAGQSLFQTDLGEVISGTNLFTNRQDTVSNFTDLLLWNNSNAPISLGEDSQLTMSIVYQ